MTVLAEFLVPAAEFVLADTMASNPEMRVEIKRVVGGTAHVTPYFWAAGGDFEAFERALHDDEMVRDVLVLEDDDGRERFYRVTWTTGVPNLISAIAQVDATVLEAVTDDGGWGVKALFPDEPALSAFHEYCDENALAYDVKRLYRPENPQERATYGVTDEQQAALEAAFRAGYYEIPRDRTMTELAADMGISRNALSARLRRGQRTLLANTLVHDEGTE